MIKKYMVYSIQLYEIAILVLMWIMQQKKKNYLASNIFVDQMIFAFVIEDNMYFLSARATDVRT